VQNARSAVEQLTVIPVSAFRFFDDLVSDTQTFTYLLGTLASDFIKVGVSAAGAGIAASAVGGATIAAGPLTVGIIVGVGVSDLAEVLDGKFLLTERLVAKLDALALEAEWTTSHKAGRLRIRRGHLGRRLPVACLPPHRTAGSPDPRATPHCRHRTGRICRDWLRPRVDLHRLVHRSPRASRRRSSGSGREMGDDRQRSPDWGPTHPGFAASRSASGRPWLLPLQRADSYALPFLVRPLGPSAAAL